VSCAEALLLVRFIVAHAFWSLDVNREVLARRCGEAKVLIFDLVVVAKALAQFEHSSEVLVFNLELLQRSQCNLSKQQRLREPFLGVVFACAWMGVLLPLAMLEQRHSH
jgi:hypothetical protein